MLLHRVVVVVTSIVVAERLVMGNDSTAFSGVRESFPESKFKFAPT